VVYRVIIRDVCFLIIVNSLRFYCRGKKSIVNLLYFYCVFFFNLFASAMYS
jgi:hypothetical protein